MSQETAGVGARRYAGLPEPGRSMANAELADTCVMPGGAVHFNGSKVLRIPDARAEGKQTTKD